MKKYLKDNDIVSYGTEKVLKSITCERVIRITKSKTYENFIVRRNAKYIDILDKIVDKYNNTKHSTIKMTPIRASKPENEYPVYSYLCYHKLHNKSKPAKYKTGVLVRITKGKTCINKKGYTQNWTSDSFKVTDFKNTNPVTYKLRDFKYEEING